MAWDKRNGMYYRSHRKGKKVTREYFGNGKAAGLAAALDDRKRRRKQEQVAAVKEVRQRWNEANKPLERLRDGTRLLLRAVRLAAMNHRGDPVMDEKSDDVIKELRELIVLGETGDSGVLPRVQHLLDQHAEIADHFGDAAKVATELWLALYVGGNAVMAEATRRKMVSLRASIAGPVPSPLETVMVEHVLVCWLQTHATEAMHAQAHQEKASDAVLRERQRQTKESQQLYAASLKQLAELRRLLPQRDSDRLGMRFPVVSDAPADDGAGSDEGAEVGRSSTDGCGGVQS
jgi:hypothetical protein